MKVYNAYSSLALYSKKYSLIRPLNFLKIFLLWSTILRKIYIQCSSCFCASLSKREKLPLSFTLSLYLLYFCFQYLSNLCRLLHTPVSHKEFIWMSAPERYFKSSNILFAFSLATKSTEVNFSLRTFSNLVRIKAIC